MVEALTGERLKLEKAAPGLIAVLRRTGGFNSDWDASYALTLFAFASLKGGEKNGTPLERLEALTGRFGGAPRKAGVKDVDSFLDEEFPSMLDALTKAGEFLEFPGRPPQSRMATLFDELYFGASLFQKTHGMPRKGPKKGFIDLERVLIKTESARALEKILGHGRLAIITGRPSLGTAYTLGKGMIKRFNREASMFIGDAELNAETSAEYEKFRKPSPEALVRASEKLSSKSLLYVGDSAEDLMMVNDAKAQGRLQGCLFAGVYGMSPDAQDQIDFFERNGADVVVKSVNEIPVRLLRARKGQVTEAK